MTEDMSEDMFFDIVGINENDLKENAQIITYAEF